MNIHIGKHRFMFYVMFIWFSKKSELFPINETECVRKPWDGKSHEQVHPCVIIMDCTKMKQSVQLQGEPKISPKSITYRCITVPLFHEPFILIITEAKDCLSVTPCSKYKHFYPLEFRKNSKKKSKRFLLGVDVTKYAPIQQVNTCQFYMSLWQSWSALHCDSFKIIFHWFVLVLNLSY